MASEVHFDSWGERMMRTFWRKPPDGIPERTRRRVTVHLLPYLFFLYILAYLDRSNVSVAQLGMKLSPQEGGLGFTDDVFGHGAGLFFWGYWILELPSTMSVAKWGARWVFVRILVLWGICATLCGFIGLPLMHSFFGWMPELSTEGALPAVAKFITQLPENSAYQFYVFRFMLGFFEGGFFPTVIVYLSYWFRQKDRAKAIACFMAAIPFSGAIGIPVSGLLLKFDWFGLKGWRWVYILEGVAPVLAGFATFFVLSNRPGDAKWLPAEERDWLQGELDEEHRNKQKQHVGHWAWLHHLGFVLVMTLAYFALNVSSYGLSMFMPAIIKSQTGASDTVATLLTGVYYTIAAAALLFNGWHSDKTGERIWHVAVPLTLQGVALFLAAQVDAVPFLPAVIFIFFVSLGHYAHLPAYWPIPTIYLGALVAASAIGFINMVGNLGGTVGPVVVGEAVTKDIGWLKEFLKSDSEKQLTVEEAGQVRPSILAASTVQDVRAVVYANRASQIAMLVLSSTMGQPTLDIEDKLLTKEQLDHIQKIDTNIEEGGKLSPEDTLTVTRTLAEISARIPVTKEEKEQLFSLLGRRASFASALRRLAPWPILSACVILLVGFLFKKKPPEKKGQVLAAA